MARIRRLARKNVALWTWCIEPFDGVPYAEDRRPLRRLSMTLNPAWVPLRSFRFSVHEDGCCGRQRQRGEATEACGRECCVAGVGDDGRASGLVRAALAGPSRGIRRRVWADGEKTVSQHSA